MLSLTLGAVPLSFTRIMKLGKCYSNLPYPLSSHGWITVSCVNNVFIFECVGIFSQPHWATKMNERQGRTWVWMRQIGEVLLVMDRKKQGDLHPFSRSSLPILWKTQHRQTWKWCEKQQGNKTWGRTVGLWRNRSISQSTIRKGRSPYGQVEAIFVPHISRET